jgi:hypothetical protein
VPATADLELRLFSVAKVIRSLRCQLRNAHNPTPGHSRHP